MNSRGFFLAFNFVLFRSEAFVVPIWKAKVVGKYPSSIFARNDESATSFNEGKNSGLDNKIPNQIKDASPQSGPLQQIKTTLAPAADFLDNVSDGWALSYANLTPNRYVFYAELISYESIFFSQTGTVKELFLVKYSLRRT